MSFLRKLVISLLPAPLLVAAGLICIRFHWRPGPVSSILLSCLAFLAWRLASARQGIPGPRLGSPLGLLLGVGIGAVLTICSIIAMGVVGGYPFELHPPSDFTLLHWPAQQVQAACLEETFVRGGSVHFLASFFGSGWAYLGGSVPFALMHFWSGWFSWRHLVCISSAGLMLSAAYLEYGLLAAIDAHFTWNVLTRLLIESLNWPVGTSVLEGAWTTTFIMLAATLAMIALSHRRNPAQQRHRESDPQDARAAEKVDQPIERGDAAIPINPAE
jgi:membrane protease YdiL (CAAX protease family)